MSKRPGGVLLICIFLIWVFQANEAVAEPLHHAPLYWFPWALLAAPFVGSIIACLLVWWKKLWI